MRVHSTATLNAQNTFCNNVEISGWFNVSVRGTFNGTVALQRMMNGQNTYANVATYNNAAETYIFEPEGQVQYRLGFPTGAYNNGNATVRISR